MLFQSKEEKIKAAREAITAEYREFLAGEGKLPEGFSFRYDSADSRGNRHRGTPFDAYLHEIWKTVDSLRDESGISDWLYLSAAEGIEDAAGIDIASRAILEWAARHRAMEEQIRQKCRVGNTTFFVSTEDYAKKKVMVVMEDAARFGELTPGTAVLCREAGIGFCILTSDRSFLDLTEQRERRIVYETFPNYHDETYGMWKFD